MKIFKEYFSYIIYVVALIIAIPGLGYKEHTGVFWKDNFRELFVVSIILLIIIINYIINGILNNIKEKKFLDSLHSDLILDRSPLFIQIRKSKVPYIASNILQSISKAVLSKEWWDFSYLLKDKDVISEIENSFCGNNKAASLTIFKKLPLSKNYIFIGTIQNSAEVNFPNSVIFNQSFNSPYKLEFDRLYVYKQKRNLFSKQANISYQLFDDNTIIKKKFEKITNKLQKNIGDGNSLHVHWDTNANVTFPNSCDDFRCFIDKIEKL